MPETIIKYFVEQWFELYKKAPLSTFIATVISLTLLVGTIVHLDKEERIQRENQRIQRLNYSKQLESLQQTRNTLESLIQFVDLQSSQVKQTEATISTLKSEHNKLKPIVETDRKTIDLIFSEQEQRNRVAQKRERWIGFIYGVASSLVGAILWAIASYMFNRRHSEQAKPALNSGPAPTVD